MTLNLTKRRVGTSLVLAAGLILCHGRSYAAGISLQEQDGAEAGDAFAGTASAAQNVSTVYYNPAGMTQLNGTQLSVAGQLINYGIHFTDGGTKDPLGRPIGGTGGNAGATLFAPDIYAQTAIGDKLRAGIAVNTPYGFVTSYQDGWEGRYAALTSQITNININPALAYKVMDNLSVGAGFDAGYTTIKLNQNIDAAAQGVQQCISTLGAGAAAFCQATYGGSPDSFAQITGSGWGYGWDAGAMYQINSQLRAGASYRSEIHYTLEGSEAIHGAGANFSSAHVGFVTPENAHVGLTDQLNDKWTAMGNVDWTGWSVFNQLNLTAPQGKPLAIPFDWKDTYTFALGTTYRYDQHCLGRFGVAYDETPVRSGRMLASVPDTGRWRVSLGGQYKFDSHSAVDLAYSHLFTNRAAINENAGGTDLIGSYVTDSNLVSLQYTFSF